MTDDVIRGSQDIFKVNLLSSKKNAEAHFGILRVTLLQVSNTSFKTIEEKRQKPARYNLNNLK